MSQREEKNRRRAEVDIFWKSGAIRPFSGGSQARPRRLGGTSPDYPKRR
jgi:hypothetical protein